MSDSNSPDAILGEDFLTWLWYKSDVDPAGFLDKNGSPFAVYVEQKITVSGGAGQTRETASVTGALSPLREARFGLAAGKKVTRALLRLEQGDSSFVCALKAENLSPTSLKTPKIRKENEDDEPDALLLEKFYLIEICLNLIDSLYAAFVNLRFSPDWSREERSLALWLEKTEQTL